MKQALILLGLLYGTSAEDGYHSGTTSTHKNTHNTKLNVQDNFGYDGDYVAGGIGGTKTLGNHHENANYKNYNGQAEQYGGNYFEHPQSYNQDYAAPAPGYDAGYEPQYGPGYGKRGPPGPPGPPGAPGDCGCKNSGYAQPGYGGDNGYGYGGNNFANAAGYGGYSGQNNHGSVGGYGLAAGTTGDADFGTNYQSDKQHSTARTNDEKHYEYPSGPQPLYHSGGGYGGYDDKGYDPSYTDKQAYGGDYNTVYNGHYGDNGYGYSNVGYGNGHGVDHEGFGHGGRGYSVDEDVKYREQGKGQKAHERTYKASSLETNNDGYVQDVAYAGDEYWTGATGGERGYTKGETYETGGYADMEKGSHYGGKAVYQQDDLKQDYKVAYEVDHGLSYKNDYKDENHKGYYKGNEFDVNYEATDVRGGYKGEETHNKAKGAAYDGAEWKGKKYNGGEYYGEDYTKHGDASQDGSYVEYFSQNPGRMHESKEESEESRIVYSRNAGDTGNMYARFRGDEENHIGKTRVNIGTGHYSRESISDNTGSQTKKKKIHSTSSDATRDFNGYGMGGGVKSHPGDENAFVRTGDYSNEGDFKGYGANYKGADEYGKADANEGYYGHEETTEKKVAFDAGDYRAVDAKGHNKAAAYEGDYQTANKEHNVDYKVKHMEDFNVDFNTDVKSDAYTAGYYGKDGKGAWEAENKYGAFHDKEYEKEHDKNTHVKDYYGESFVDGFSGETAGIYYKGAENDHAYHTEKIRRPGQNGKGDGYYEEPANNYYYPGNDDYMKNRSPSKHRRRMLDMETKMNQLVDARVAQLELKHIATSKDIGFAFLAVLVAAIFGSIATLFITSRMGCLHSRRKMIVDEPTEVLMQ